ncbi:AAA family ATPase [Carboxydochorda subterranea]|uniref:AAA family ATPase n=1 Tax=Carboxydichorda subterranea TaxID=3109565 RepID=A0ABZ1C0Y1_9FIRM|nr:AAA family ATPase [Limnochorda sp. L945t]WRP18745.1 AAA family ATPase [Limnochorda sp. L945t]
MSPEEAQAEIRRAVELLLVPGQVTELRVEGATTREYRRPHLEVGYFDNLLTLATWAASFARRAQGLYVVLNPLNHALLARANNHMRVLTRDGPRTTELDVERWQWLIITLDPRRPAGVPPSNTEHEAALRRARAIRVALAEEGWPAPVLVDSGTGACLLYHVSLPRGDDALVRHSLEALARRFSDAGVAVDPSTASPVYPVRLPGTAAREGDSTPDRPHRYARILEAPGTLELVPKSRLEVLAGSRPDSDASPNVEPIILTVADVEPARVEFLWEPYLPLGKLTLLDGDPGVGKSWVALAIAAALSHGTPPGQPDEPLPVSEPADTVYITAEDDVADTIRPRLAQLGADLRRIHVLPAVRVVAQRDTRTSGDDEEDRRRRRAERQAAILRGDAHERPFTLLDVELLRRVLEERRPKLVVIDPLEGHLPPDTDLNRAEKVRPVLQGLARVATDFHCSVLVLRHLSKEARDRALYRGLGSIDLAAVARSVLLAGADPKSPGDRALVHIKSNLGPRGPSLGYRIDKDGFAWTGPSTLTAVDLLAPERAAGEAQVERAKAFLVNLLQGGPVPQAQVEEEARRAGISRRTLQRAKGELEVESRRHSQPGAPRGTGEWLWTLPAPAASADAEAGPPGQASMAPSVGNLEIGVSGSVVTKGNQHRQSHPPGHVEGGQDRQPNTLGGLDCPASCPALGPRDQDRQEGSYTEDQTNLASLVPPSGEREVFEL